jgi:hypothetical protein
MGRLLLNRFTKYSIITVILGLVSLGFGAWVWNSDGARTLLITFAIVLFLSGLGLEVLGFSKAKHFSQVEALKTYERVKQLVLELRKTGSVLHKEYSGYSDIESRWKYDRDRRYQDLSRRIDEAMGDCDDRFLAKTLGDLIESEKRLARRGINLSARTLRFAETLEMVDPDIKNYISTNIKGQ